MNHTIRQSNTNRIEHAETYNRIKHFCHKHYFDCDTFEKIFKDNGKVQIKNFTRKHPCKKLRQILLFFYMKIMKLPSAQFFIPRIIIKIFFESINNIMKGKIHLQHFHTTGQIIGYAHSFFNLSFPLLAHNLFGFDFFFFAKEVRLWVWRIKYLLIGGTNFQMRIM